ncbi:TetR/AcrR family transcriptional regulator [Eubacterium xylanophilum]|uniref:TetR/AcrR family transcriptional regulator n=1 Tax=Eubacterium xylanophilum TaxID=39497 RepID=UPI00047D6E97|nr:TetR/AcrR family transcriptional regulator [Eubacterium xylanophilum]
MNAFTVEERTRLRENLIDEGFLQLKEGGYKNVNIDNITSKCYISKGSFYSFFKSKSDFMYEMMLKKRSDAKNKILELSGKHKLDYTGLKAFIMWLLDEDINIFSYMSDEEQDMLIKMWPPSNLNNSNQNFQTISMIITLLEKPKPNPNPELFCNYMKLISVTQAKKKLFLSEAYDDIVIDLVEKACDCISYRR